MGGYGSGRPGVLTAVEDSLRLDLASPAIRSVIRSGCSRQGSWSWGRDGERTGSVSYELYTAASDDDERARLTLSYSVNGVATRQTVPLVRSRPNFGGWRWWFLCPVLLDRGERRRVRAIFLPPGARYFGSRTAHRLNYRSQKESRSLPRLIERLLQGA